MKLYLKIITLALFLLLTTSCTVFPKPQQKPQTPPTKIQVQISPELAQQVKNIIKAVNEVDESTVVVINKEISAAVKVSGFKRLRLKSIKQEVHSKIKETNKDYTVRVTTDKKLFKQLQSMEKQINKGQEISLPELKRKFDKINKDMQS